MSTVADKLRQAREAQKLTIQQLAEITKIRSDHIRALEEGNFDVFTAPVYIRGFVRTCAGLLKLDVRQIMAELDAELGRTEKFREPPPLTDQKRGPLDFLTLQLSRIDWRKGSIVLGILFALIVLMVGMSVWRRQRARDPLSGLKPSLYQSPQTNSGEMLPVPQPQQRR